MSEHPTKQILIVGGGTAGWLTAGIIAAEHMTASESGVQVTLIESNTIPTIGVGEGTWPTMRDTLMKMGIDEKTFIRQCDAAYKQGSKFVDWLRPDHSYYHPYSLPHGYLKHNLVPFWQQTDTSYAHTLTTQAWLCDYHKAPKQYATPDYAAVANYGYHLDAGKFAELLKQHCIAKLGVKHIVDNVTHIHDDDDGYISSVDTQNSGMLHADLFIDCSGASALLLGKHCGIPLTDCSSILFNDTAIAFQAPYSHDDADVSSVTLSTAKEAGWIWDIGINSRRGTGYTFSRSHISESSAVKTLLDYHQKTSPHLSPTEHDFRLIKFTPGHRETFWYKNCVAVGMSAGFIEPLEATAIAMIEKSASVISERLPVNRHAMTHVAGQYNTDMRYRWDRILDFLKLHYVLSQRADSPYWLDNKCESSIPESLSELLSYWQYQPPSRFDFTGNEEVFPSASYQYVLYGMEFCTQGRQTLSRKDDIASIAQPMAELARLKQQHLNGLPSHRELLNYINNKV